MPWTQACSPDQVYKRQHSRRSEGRIILSKLAVRSQLTRRLRLTIVGTLRSVRFRAHSCKSGRVATLQPQETVITMRLPQISIAVGHGREAA